jgi:thioredoxin-like negative regulator of GroEL
MAGRANVLKVDTDESPGLASRFGVKSVPTLLLFRGGELVWRAVGLQQIDELETAVARYSDAKDKDCIS